MATQPSSMQHGIINYGLPSCSSLKSLSANSAEILVIPYRWGEIPEEDKWQSTLESLPEIPWTEDPERATVHGVVKSDTTQQQLLTIATMLYFSCTELTYLKTGSVCPLNNQNHWLVPFEWMSCMVLELCLNKFEIKLNLKLSLVCFPSSLPFSIFFLFLNNTVLTIPQAILVLNSLSLPLFYQISLLWSAHELNCQKKGWYWEVVGREEVTSKPQKFSHPWQGCGRQDQGLEWGNPGHKTWRVTLKARKYRLALENWCFLTYNLPLKPF